MAHYALLDENNVVVNVITGKDETDTTHDWEQYYGEFHGMTCKRTSYNTYGNQHQFDGQPFRGNYAGIGGTYDPIRDAFINKKPFNSWVLNEATLLWETPTPIPNDWQTVKYYWDEDVVQWKILNSL